MNEKNLGISQKSLVSGAGDRSIPARKLPQYAASLASTLGALAGGMVLAWSSPAGDNGIKLQSLYNINISMAEFSWISSLATIGGGVMCITSGILADIMGRKHVLLLMVVPFTVGWLLIIFANSVLMFYFGRFITGLGCGAFGVVAPMYAAEISENDIRGTLGSFYQLLLTVGILLTYALGTGVDMRVLSIVSAIVPLVFFGIFMFMPESPIFYLKKGDEDSARKSLTRLRGAQYNVEGELQSHKEAIEENSKSTAPFCTLIKSKATIKAFIVAYGLMFFQQLCGVNVIIFYTNSIFEKAGSTLDSGSSSVIVGAMQVIAVLLSTLVVDRIGRRILLLLSIIFLGLTSFALGTYFYLSQVEVNVDSIRWLPLVSVCIFIIMFNMGFGPLAWMMLGELFAPEVKGVAASSAGLFNYLLAFIVTKFFGELSYAINLGPTFWLFTVICVIGAFFVYLLVPETKGKSLEEIQRILSGM